MDLPRQFLGLPVLIAELRISSAPHREQKQFSPFPLSLSVTRLPKLNLIDAEVLSYALILLIIICHAAEEGGQIENAPECVLLIVAKRERGSIRLGTLSGVGVSATLCCPSQIFPLNQKKQRMASRPFEKKC